jgi:hypothetical protein
MQEPIDVAVGGQPIDVAAGDFDGDGKVDFVSTNGKGLAVRMQRGETW